MASEKTDFTHLVRFGPEEAKAFKRLYEKSAAAGLESFEFAGGTWLVSYARYVCEYLAMRGIL